MILKYDPQKVTDWLTPLEKVYARQSAQLDRYHGQLRERDRQEEEATIDLPEVFSKLASFSSSIKSTVEANKTKRQKKQRIEAENVFNTASSMQELRNINKDYKLKKKGLLENWDKYEELILASTKLTDEQKSYALKTSPRRQLVLKEVLAQSIVSNLDNSWQEDFKNMTGKEQDAFELLDDEGKNDYKREWVDKKLGDYKYSDGFLLENIQTERDRFLSTKNKLTAIKAKNLKFTQDQAEFEAEGDQYNLTGTPEQRGAHNRAYVVKHSALNSDPNSEDTPTQQGVQKWMVAQSKILRKGEDSLGDLEKILNSKVKHKGHVTDDNPEGWTTFEKAFLSEDQVAQLTKDANIGVNTKWERDVASTEFKQKADLQRLQAGEMTNEERLAEIDRLKQIPTANKELITELEEFNPDAQNPQRAADVDQDFKDKFISGELTEELIKEEPNYQVRAKWLKIFEKRKAWENKNSWTEQEGVFEGETHQYTRNKSLDIGEKQTKDELNANILIKQKANQLKAEKLLLVEQTGIPNPNILTEIQEEVQAWKEREGWGEEKGPGLFSYVRKNGNATLPNLSNNLKRLNTVGYHYNTKNPNMKSSYNSRLRNLPENTTRAIRHETVDGIYSKDLLLGFSQNGYFNEEMKYIASEEGLLPGEAYELAIKALENGDEDDEKFLVRYNFKRGEKEPEPDVQMNNMLTQRLEAIASVPESTLVANESEVIRNIQNIMRWYGPDSLNMNQRKLIYSILQMASPVTEGLDPIQAKTQQLRVEGKTEKEIKEWWQLYRDKKFKENIEGGALDLQNIPIG